MLVSYINHMLDHCCGVLGQLVNYYKSKIHFSKGIIKAEYKKFYIFLMFHKPTPLAPTWAVRILIIKEIE